MLTVPSLARQRRAAVLLLAGMALAAGCALYLHRPPRVVSAQAVAGQLRFSAENALPHLKEIAAEPHPAGTLAHARVRDYIVGQCRTLGMEAEVVQSTGLRQSGSIVRAGRAQNIIARLPGRGFGKAILVMAHYDSTPNSPGAGDDGAAAAAMIEVMRLLKSAPRLQNDVIFLFTDLEEAGLLGAEAFAHAHPRLADIGLVLNFEARGSSGPVYTFEVSSGNGWLMREFRKAVGGCFANSFAYQVYRRLPNDTDFSVFRDAGIAGLNSAFIHGFSRYHRADRVESLDLRSLQHHGEILLGTLLHFGNLPLENTRSDDAVFFNPAGSWLLIYPAGWDTALQFGAVLLLAITTFVGYRKGRLRLGFIALGILLLPVLVASALGAAWLAMKGVGAIYPHYADFPGGHFYNSHAYLWAIAGLSLFCFACIYGWFGRKRPLVGADGPSDSAARFDAHESLFFGALFVLAILMFFSNKVSASYLVYYPLIFAVSIQLVLFGGNMRTTTTPGLFALAQLALVAPAFALWLPYATSLFIAFDFGMPFGGALFFALSTAMLLPSLGLLRALSPFAIPISAICLILVGLVAGHRTSAISPGNPGLTSLAFVAFPDSGQAFWITDAAKLDDWTRHYFASEERGPAFDSFLGQTPLWKHAAPLTEFPACGVDSLQDTTEDGRRRLKLRVVSSQMWQTIRLDLPLGATLLAVDRRPVNAAQSETRLTFHAPPPEGFEIELSAPAEPIVIRIAQIQYALPPSLVREPMPPELINASTRLSGQTIAIQAVDI